MVTRLDTKLVRRTGVMAALLLGAVLATSQLWTAEGWPENHEHDYFAIRTLILADHVSQGDPLAVWSVTDNLGFGSPQPALYHKLFYMVASPLVAAGVGLKPALIIALVAFLMAGGLGTYRLARSLCVQSTAATACGLTFIFASYTTTNWLIRGALAELSAAMIVPWVLWSLVLTLQRSELMMSMPVGLALLLWAHSVLGYFVGALALVVIVCAGAAGRLVVPDLLRWRRVLAGGALFVVLAGLPLSMILAMGDGYDLGRLLPTSYLPQNQFRPFSDYVFDSGWTWGERSTDLTVQLDLPVVIVLLVAALAFTHTQRRRAGSDQDRRLAMDTSATWALWVVAGVCLLLQLPVTGPIYEHAPGARYLQFPWRLLGVITPSLIVLAFLYVQRAVSGPWRTLVGGGVLATTAVLGGALVPIEYERILLKDDLAVVSLSNFGEYVPTAAGTAPPPPRLVAAEQRRRGCVLHRELPIQETRHVTFTGRCDAPTSVPLPIFRSRLHRVEVGGDRHGCIVPSDPWTALCGVELNRGDQRITVEMPTFFALATDLLS